MALSEYVLKKASDGMLSWPSQLEIAEQAGVTLREVDEAALKQQILPARYKRNLPDLSVQEQYILFKSRVGVVGCGGLGGYVIEELARLGVGAITAVDYDVFEEHNLNRQLLSQTALIGQSKAMAAVQRVQAVNPAVVVDSYVERLDEANSPVLLKGCQVVVDALDNISTRKVLSRACSQFRVPLVHGAIGGWYGQVTTQFPGDNTVDLLYERVTDASLTQSGMLVFAPAVIASLQVAEVIKILLGKGRLLRRKIMFINLLDMEVEVMELSSPTES